MRRPILFAILSFSVQILFAQSELAKRNGFKTIKLGMHVDSVKGTIFKKDIMAHKEFPAKLYEVEHPEYSKVGTVQVKKIELKTYKGLIYEILVHTDKDPQIMRGLEKSYGKPTYSIRTETYYWTAKDTLSLIYKGHNKHLALTYRSNPVIKIMYVDKGKKLEEIAEDF
jgi:hypothetical protein